jgi:two-component system chemotaxis response regulator CheY
VRNLLRQLGFTSIDEASNGSTALAKMRAKKYQLVISKQALAPPSGLEDSAQRPPVLQIGGDAVTAQNLKAKLVSVLGAF